MKIKKLSLSDKVILLVAEDISNSFSVSKYEQFLIKHDLLSYNPYEYSRWNKIDFICATLQEIDSQLFLELDKTGVLSDETKSALIQEEVVFEEFADKKRDVKVQEKKRQPALIQKPSSNQVNINGNVTGSTIIIGNENAVQNLHNKRTDILTTDEILEIVKLSSPDDWDINFSQDAEIAIFKKNPSIRIETRHTGEFIHNDDFREKWANKFLDPHATSYYYHLYYGATRFKEFILVSVDGGRALLPLPKFAMDLSVEPIRYKIALIFDRFGSCDEYMSRAGLYLEK